ncbi:hypothetical protein P154DRAFT_597572 [Amniculicola lignicola CBS 123094]|uniref:P-loop containing nucleoside triphosphate hydrolase protein n=1 Tax=Amniculicola lignicola CBS 123094 TaxID=1392246 RepID=A0A6A5WZV2_9PLEO|nr:hypothetical protein P154DRAFT_597572 [Amniculicola lignicola CBS 123094]
MLCWIRSTCLILLCALALIPTGSTTSRDEERESLLSSESETYGSLEDGTEEAHKVDKEASKQKGALGKQHQERLEELGGWWGYLQRFRIFLPFVIPLKKEDRHMQVKAVGVGLLLITDRAANLAGPLLVGNIVDRITELKGTDQIPWQQILIFTFGIRLPHGMLTALRSCLSIRCFYWSYGELSKKSFGSVMGLSLDFHENKDTGEVETAMRQGQTLNHFVDELVVQAIPLLLDVVIAFCYLSYVFDIYLGLIIIVIGVLYTMITYRLTAWSSNHRRDYQEMSRQQTAICNSSIANWQLAAFFNRQSYHQERFDRATWQEIDSMSKFYDLGEIKVMCQGFVTTLGYGVLLLYAAHLVTTQSMPVGNIVMLLLYWSIFTKPLFTLSGYYKDLINYLIDAERLLEIWQKKPTVRDSEKAKPLAFHGGKVYFEDVTFSYDPSNQVIKGINLSVPAGSTVAFVGQSGSGKTTCCSKLLLRFYDVTSGSIKIDDQDIRDITLHSLRETVGIVPQDPSFFNDSILEIVRYARLDAIDEEVFEACRNAAIHDKILRFPRGYFSKVGERGVKLSGGEKQRLAIAQIFLRDPKIVVLDEATSNVDTLTEVEIQESFAKIRKGRTTFVVAHRLSTVKNVDQIVVLGNGKIVERGTHEELLELGGMYWQLWAGKKRADKLHQELALINSITEEGKSIDIIAETLIDLSDTTESSVSFEDLRQVDGQRESKPSQGSNFNCLGARKKVHSFKERLTSKKQEGEPEESLEIDETADDTAPMQTVSPRPTEAADYVAPAGRSFSLRRRPRDMNTDIDQPLLRPITRRTTISVTVAPTDGSPIHETNISAGSPTTSLPRRDTCEALTSHAAEKEEEDPDGEPSAYHTPGS